MIDGHGAGNDHRQIGGSGLKATHLAAQAIKCNEAEIIIAGGQENMSVRACHQSRSSSFRSTHSAASVPAAPESKYRLT
jgi:acetyl-CoA acetyltransferase